MLETQSKMVTRTFAIPPGLWQVLERTAARVGLSRSRLIRDAVVSYLHGGVVLATPEGPQTIAGESIDLEIHAPAVLLDYSTEEADQLAAEILED